MSSASAGWEKFANEVAEVVFVPVESVSPDARLIEDLGADSLAVVELVTALIDEYELSAPDGIDPARWRALTAGQLFESVAQGSLP